MGKVKSRLAATIGEEYALHVYKDLLQKTNQVTLSLKQEKFLFYSDYIENDDWSENDFNKQVQYGTSLGDRISNAFKLLQKQDYQKIIIIGSDCYDITPELIQNAFQSLDHFDLVIGPANDGGYYLLGTKGYFHDLFMHISWSTDSVLNQTIEKANSLKLKVKLLEELVDLDTFDDLKKSNFPLNSEWDVH